MVVLVQKLNEKEHHMYSPFKTVVRGAVAVAVGSSLFLIVPQAQAAPVGSSTASHASAAVSPAATLSAPVTGSFTDASGGQGVFSGTFTPTGFTAPNDQVVATGKLTGTLTDSAGIVLGTVNKTVSSPLDTSASTAATPALACQILDLRIQPIDLNLLGLKVHLDAVHLNITAQSGPGNLLGNLLCAVAGLLDGGGLAGLGATLAGLLNQIIAILNGL
jgi:hypothetical protein